MILAWASPFKQSVGLCMKAPDATHNFMCMKIIHVCSISEQKCANGDV